jgi:hypothetical protein
MANCKSHGLDPEMYPTEVFKRLPRDTTVEQTSMTLPLAHYRQGKGELAAAWIYCLMRDLKTTGFSCCSPIIPKKKLAWSARLLDTVSNVLAYASKVIGQFIPQLSTIII